MPTRAYRGIGPVPTEALARLGEGTAQQRAAAIEALAGWMEQVRAQAAVNAAIASASSSSAGGATTPAPAPTPGPPGPPGPAAPPYTPDLTPPPTPSGVVVTAGLDFVFITTDAPTFTEGNGYLRTRVYAAQYGGAGPLPTFGDAVLRHEFSGQVGSFAAPPNTQWHIWLKWRTNDGVLSVSPEGGANGHQVTTSSIGNVHLGPLIVEAGNLASGAVTASKLAAEAVTLTAFAAGIRPVRVLAALPALPAAGYSDGDTAVLTADGKLYRIVAGAWTRATDGADIVANSITAGSIAAGAIGTDQLAANAVTTGKLLVTGRGRALNDDPTISDASAWTLGASISIQTGTGVPGAAGSRFFSATTGGTNHLAESRRFTVDPAKQYRLTANLYAQSGNDRNQYVFVRMWNGAGVELNGADTGWGGTLAGYVFGGITPPGVWTRQGDSFGAGTPRPIPDSVREIAVGAWFQYSGSGTSSVVQAAQDIRCEESVGADLIVDGSIIASKIAANAIAVGTAAIQNGAIVNAMIADATISDAKIVTLSASKIIAGSLAVGEYIQSSGFVPGSGAGFRIDGGGGFEARFSGGTRVFHLGASGADPILRAPGLDILANGSATFSGTVSAATIVGSSISGGSITGTVIQTAASGERFVVNEGGSNEAWFYGDRGDGTIERLAAIGITSVGSDFVIGNFGSATSSRTAIMARANGASAIYGIAYSNFTSAIIGQSIATGGTGVQGTTNSDTGIGVQGTALGAGARGISGTNLTGPGVYGSTNNGIGVHGVAAVSGDGVRGDSASGYGGRFTGNATKPPLMLTEVINTSMPTSAEVGSLAMVRFPAIGGGGGNIRLCYVDQFGTWRYVATDSAI